MKKKCRLFLGAYINSINAQNINCRSIAKHIDKSRFEVGVMEVSKGELNSISNIKVFKSAWPHRVSRYITYARGILWADVVYLPKLECFHWTMLLLRIFKRPSFCTSESIISKSNLEKIISEFGSIKKYKKIVHSFSSLYAISSFIKNENYHLHKLNYKSELLTIGVEGDLFSKNIKTELKSVVLIGNNLYYKGWDVYLDLAKLFPNITFHVVGSGNQLVSPTKDSKHFKNIICHGQLSHSQLNDLLKHIDLHVFPSRSEGFPKVLLESAAAGVPSLVFSDYGAKEWLKAGFIVNTKLEMVETIKNLLDKPALLTRESKKALSMSNDYDWSKIISTWEDVILNLYRSK